MISNYKFSIGVKIKRKQPKYTVVIEKRYTGEGMLFLSSILRLSAMGKSWIKQFPRRFDSFIPFSSRAIEHKEVPISLGLS